jgi:hypothetical protein
MAQTSRIAARTCAAVLALSLGALGIACGSTNTSEFDGPPDGGGPGNGTGNGGGPDGASGGGGLEGDRGECASNVLCGSRGTCCAVGEQCVEGECRTACASGIRCGAVCCDAGNVCLAGACTAPRAPCQDSFDCEENEFCEPTLSKCLPQPNAATRCEYRPPVLPFNPTLEWSWSQSAIQPTFLQVINMPVVLDVTGDGFPEVFIVTSGNTDDFNESRPAYLRSLDGRNGQERWPASADVYKDENRVQPRVTPAIGDIDGDGVAEVITGKLGGGVIAFRANDGAFLWRSKLPGGADYNGSFNSATVALADMDNDGKAEIVIGGVVLDHTGVVVSGVGRERAGSNDSTYGPVSIVADVDGNPNTTAQHVVTGNGAYLKDGTPLWQQPGLSDGYTAIADLDKDGTPELVVIASRRQGNAFISIARIQNAITGDLLATLDVPGNGRGGPPTIADFDGDGVMEFASANGNKYVVFEYDPNANPKISVKWQKDTQDISSNVTGSSVFDFEGDGKAEVVYNDECYARVYRGTDGEVLFEVPNSTGTIHEYPILVDIDGDNNTEFVVVANNRNHGANTCPTYAAAGHQPRTGVYVYGDANDKWVRTRKLWNQQAYHITNVESNGRIPQVETRSFTTSANNNYRVSSQGAGVFNAPDLKVDLEVSTASCPAGLELRARVKNEGSLGVPAGVEVVFYEGNDAQGPRLGDKKTTRPLLPGESEVVTLTVSSTGGGQGRSFFVVVDGGATGGTVDECNGDNNTSTAGGVECPRVR